MLKKIIILISVLCLLSGCSPLVESVSSAPVFFQDNTVNNFLVSGDDLWVATNGGVVRWNIESQTYRRFTESDWLAGNNVTDIAQDSKGNIWAVAGGNINYFDGKEWRIVATECGTVYNVATGKDNMVVISGAYDTYRYDGYSWQLIRHIDTASFCRIVYLEVDKQGHVWEYNLDEGLVFYDGQTWNRVTEVDNWLITDVNEMVSTSSAVLVIYGGVRHKDSLTNKDAFLLPNNNSWEIIDWQIYDITIPFLPGGIHAFTSDNNGNLWCCVYRSEHGKSSNILSNRIVRYKDDSWEIIIEKPLPVNPLERIEIMAIDDNENVWCGTANGLYMFNGEDWQSYVTNDYILKQ